MFRLIPLALIALPFVEIALFIQAGRIFGLWPTLLGVIAMSLAGVLVLRLQGLAMMARLRETVGLRILPARDVADAMLRTLGGVLLVVPGFLTGAIGALLLVPQIRALLYARAGGGTGPSGSPGSPGRDPRLIELDEDEYRGR